MEVEVATSGRTLLATTRMVISIAIKCVIHCISCFKLLTDDLAPSFPSVPHFIRFRNPRSGKPTGGKVELDKLHPSGAFTLFCRRPRKPVILQPEKLMSRCYGLYADYVGY